MIAIIADTDYPELFGLDEHLPLPLFPLVDRPILQHVIEYLAVQGIKRFEFILNRLPEMIEANLGDGARWGCSFRFHLFPASGKPYHLAQAIATGLDDEILLGRLDCLPEFDLAANRHPVIFYTSDGRWTGWAVLPMHPSHLADFDRDPAGLPTPDGFAKEIIQREMNFQTGTAFLQSQHDLLSGIFPAFPIGGIQNEAGIWISRNVSLHPTVDLRVPAYIGPNCKIGRGARIGPSAVVSENCIIDEQSSVQNSLVAPGTYIGQGLELEQVIVDRNRLLNAKIGTTLLVSDTFLLSSLTERNAHLPLQRLFSCFAALPLALVLWPVTALVCLYLTLRKKGSFGLDQAVRTPAGDNPGGWREFRIPRFRTHSREPASRCADLFLRLSPGLFSVMKGDLFLVGVQPRTRREIERLPHDWKSIYLKSKGGLITEALVMSGNSPSEDELYTAEAYYSAAGSFRHDLTLAWRYLLGLLA
jgi:lipopolysaccharide/colanic/teichoic acid biosynthesis glycosyltransferase/carbonic anhydrase/acetyltransferase-like protein (isoleucine patch superfamily)